MKNYRFLGEEAEILGQRLDHARASLARSTNAWAKNFWQQTVDRLLFQWRQLPILHDGDAQAAIIPRWSIDYDFFEKGGAHENYGITEKFYDRVFKEDADLHASWEWHRANRLAKAQ